MNEIINFVLFWPRQLSLNTEKVPNFCKKFAGLSFFLFIRYQNFLLVCWFYCKNITNFVYCSWKVHNPTDITQGRLKIWTADSHWFSVNLKPAEISQPKFYHLYIFLKYDFSQNLKGVAQKMGPPRPIQF